jgi:hypothetical protein
VELEAGLRVVVEARVDDVHDPRGIGLSHVVDRAGVEAVPDVPASLVSALGEEPVVVVVAELVEPRAEAVAGSWGSAGPFHR